MKKKKKSFLIAGFLIIANLSFLLFSEEVYRLRMNFYASSWGTLIFIIPYRAYAEVGADLVLQTENKATGKVFNFLKIGSPVYYVQTIDFIPKEIHARVGAKSVKEGVKFGNKKLKEICKNYPIFCKNIPPEKKKALPFLFKRVGKDVFHFFREKKGNIPEDSIYNGIELYYAWPAKSKFGIPSYNMLKASLCFFNIRFREFENGGKSHYRVLNINLNKCLNEVLYYAVPAVKRFVHLRQKRLFHMNFEREIKDGNIFLKGESFPDVKVWGKFKIKYFKREIIIDSSKEEIVSDKIFLSIKDFKGRGGEGSIELFKIK